MARSQKKGRIDFHAYPSQAIPSQAERALSGEDGAFDQLDASIQKVASLRRGASLGRSADWQQLESQASAILARRPDVEALHASASNLEGAAQTVLYRLWNRIGVNGF